MPATNDLMDTTVPSPCSSGLAPCRVFSPDSSSQRKAQTSGGGSYNPRAQARAYVAEEDEEQKHTEEAAEGFSNNDQDEQARFYADEEELEYWNPDNDAEGERGSGAFHVSDRPNLCIKLPSLQRYIWLQQPVTPLCQL